jgi:hypothetical protein
MGKEIESACRVVLPGELAKWGTVAGTKAVMTFSAWPECESSKDTATYSADGIMDEDNVVALPATARATVKDTKKVLTTATAKESGSPLSPVEY